MRRGILVSLATIAIAASARSASAQVQDVSLSPFQTALVCGPPADAQPPSGRILRVRGAQDTRATSMFGAREQLVIDGGTDAGVQLGQEYFVRRSLRFGMPYTAPPHGALNVARIRIVAVNESTAIATVLQMCDAVLRDDYVEAFTMPVAPPDAERNLPAGELDFTILSRVGNGTEHRDMGATGDLMTMSSGTDQGVAPGARFAIYRDVKVGGMPLTSVGEAVVIAAGKTQSVFRITQTRDAVHSGDYLVPRK
jgi:hypothetical protein